MPAIRKRVLFCVDEEALSYLDEKGKLFESKGGKGGRSEALNRIVLFMRDYEPEIVKLMEESEN